MTNMPAISSARRSLLFMPGDSTRKIEKSLTLDVDTVILDLEDGVAQNRKVAARAVVTEALRTLDFGRRERIVRVNALNSRFVEQEVQATAPAHPDAYLLPKVETAGDLLALEQILSQAEDALGRARHSFRLLAMIETALGVMNLREICQATARLDALVFGAEDLAASTGAIRTKAGWEVFYARSAVVTAASAYGLQPIDCVFVDLADVSGFEAECVFARQLGFVGKTLIHPNQVEAANRIFAPAPDEVDWAQRLIAAFQAHQQSGAGAFAFEGKMVDMPILRSAQRILGRAQVMPDLSQ
jgi:citrate lyase beta subunit